MQHLHRGRVTKEIFYGAWSQSIPADCLFTQSKTELLYLKHVSSSPMWLKSLVPILFFIFSYFRVKYSVNTFDQTNKP